MPSKTYFYYELYGINTIRISVSVPQVSNFETDMPSKFSDTIYMNHDVRRHDSSERLTIMFHDCLSYTNMMQHAKTRVFSLKQDFFSYYTNEQEHIFSFH